MTGTETDALLGRAFAALLGDDLTSAYQIAQQVCLDMSYVMI